MKAYGQYCPIAKATEILGERWSLLVMRELLIGSRRFNDIARGLPGMSRTLLTKRLRQLEAGGLVERLDGAYELTPAGAELRPIVFGLGEWCAKWFLEDPATDELDTDILMWWAHSRLDTSPLPDRRIVLEFAFRDPPNRYWVVVESVGCSVCLHDPGFGVDVVIAADAATLHRLWYGREEISAAVRDGRITFEGPHALTRHLPQVLQRISEAHVMGADEHAPRPHLYDEADQPI